MATSGARRFSVAFWAILLMLGLSVVFVYSLSSLSGFAGDGSTFKSAFDGDGVALVRVEGVIVDGSRVIKQLDAWAADDKARAIVVRIVSPGGVVAPSQEIYDAVRRAGEKKPVVCSMGHVAASGGYYIAAACDHIVAAPGTITGSIGVIMMFDTLYDLWGKIGVGSVVVKSGAYKDTGSPNRPFTDADRKIVQGMVDDIYRQFLDAVAEGRGIDRAAARKLAGEGRIYSGAQAKEIGLVDSLGDLAAAVAKAGALGGIDGKPEILERKERVDFWGRLMEQEFEVLLPARLKLPTGVYFLWDAGV
jgi:protease-4